MRGPGGRDPRAGIYHQAQWGYRLLFEREGLAEGLELPEFPVDEGLVPDSLRRDGLRIPDLPRPQVVRHYVRLSQRNFGVDTGSYPLGSCTMKYNPKLNEELACSPHAAEMHPLLPPDMSQGTLEVLYRLQEMLASLTGMDAVSLQPAAGAQGEFVGMLIARAHHEARGQERTEVIVPDTAHGTNPASAAMAGFDVVEIPSDAQGMVDVAALEAALSERTAAFMLTNPNTLGIFEENVERIAKLVHGKGALLYYDGANFNAICGITTPGAMGFDIVHLNLHKTFSTPHGGGGPGAGPVGVKAPLAEFLPVPIVGRGKEGYTLIHDRPRSVGKVRGFHGNAGVLLRAYAYILYHGSDGLLANTRKAVLNANYLKEKLLASGHFDMPFKGLRKHEFVLSAAKLKRSGGVRAMDIAKRLLDHGVHAPTVYFPHIVEEAMMFEPTETETREELDLLAEILNRIAEEPADVVRGAPHNTSAARIDEVRAAREPVLRWTDPSRHGGQSEPR